MSQHETRENSGPPFEVREKRVGLEFEENGKRMELTGKMFTPETENSGRKPAVLFIHPKYGSSEKHIQRSPEEEARAKALAEQTGATTMIMYVRGLEDTPGDVHTTSFNQALEDFTRAYDYLASSDGIDPTRMGVFGYSWGGSMAARLTSRRAPKAIFLAAPTSYRNEDLASPYGGIPSKPAEEFYTTLVSLKNFPGKVGILFAGNDDKVSPESIQQFQATSRDNTRRGINTILGAPHDIVGNEEHEKELRTKTADFFAKAL